MVCLGDCVQDVDEDTIWGNLAEGSDDGVTAGEDVEAPAVAIDDSVFEELFVQVKSSNNKKRSKKGKAVRGQCCYVLNMQAPLLTCQPQTHPQANKAKAAQLFDDKRTQNVTIALKSFKVSGRVSSDPHTSSRPRWTHQLRAD